MQEVAAQVARDKGLPSSDYRDVIKALKKDQLVGDAILTHYQEHSNRSSRSSATSRL